MDGLEETDTPEAWNPKKSIVVVCLGQEHWCMDTIFLSLISPFLEVLEFHIPEFIIWELCNFYSYHIWREQLVDMCMWGVFTMCIREIEKEMVFCLNLIVIICMIIQISLHICYYRNFLYISRNAVIWQKLTVGDR